VNILLIGIALAVISTGCVIAIIDALRGLRLMVSWAVNQWKGKS
jgi:hypothetical protein